MAFRKKKQDPFTEIQACLQRRDYKTALAWFNALLQKDPKNTQIRLRFADTLVLAGGKKEAVKQFRIVADELAEKGFTIRAIAINKKILQIDPTQTESHQKLAGMVSQMTPERPQTPPTLTRNLEEVLQRPGAPLRRSQPEAPPPAPTPVPSLSLEESMAMEFGDSHELPGRPEPPLRAEEPIALGPPSGDYSGGFELDESALTGGSSFTHRPAADEEELEIVTAGEEERGPALDLSFEGVEAPVSEFDQAAIVLDGGEPAVAMDSTDEEEIEIIELELESEPALAADGAESLIGALGEDIDSLIDSIIDDMGSSARGATPAREAPPTHIPLFSDLTTQEFIAVALLLVRKVVKPGEQVVLEGDPGDSMFIVSTGEVRASVARDGQQVAVATMRDGDFFGEMAVLSGEPRTATVTAVKSTELLELSREHLEEICSRHPHVEAKIRLAYDERVSRSKRG